MESEGRYMWLIVMFDLPTKLKQQRRSASQFRNFLLNDGYIMLQLSIYGRIVKGQERIDKHIRRLDSQIPPKGSVKVLQVTEMQYARMKHLINGKCEEKNEEDAQISEGKQLLLF
jgi:CRISPR-associated protein Cas2